MRWDWSRLGWSALLGVAIASCAAPSHTAGWSEARTKHILLRSNLGLQQTHDTAAQLQRLHDVIASSGFECAFERRMTAVQVTVLHTAHFDELVGPNQAGEFRSSQFGWVGGHPDQVLLRGGMGLNRSGAVFQHELAHRLVASCFPLAPTWLNEGIAAFFQSAELDGDTVRLGLPTYLASRHIDDPVVDYADGRFVTVIPVVAAPTVSSLLAADGSTFYEADGSWADLRRVTYNYAGSWALVHLLQVGDPKLTPKFQRYLGALDGTHPEPNAVWRDEFANAGLQERLPKYIASLDGTHLALQVQLPERQAPTTRALDSAEADLHWAWLWGIGDAERARALAHAERALKSTKTRAQARALRVLAYRASGDRQRALQELELALQHDPAHPGLLALRLTFDFEVTEPAVTGAPQHDLAQRVRQNATALRRVASSPEELSVLAAAELMLGERQRGLDDVERALKDAPGCWRCRVVRAELLAQQQQLGAALSDLQIALNLIPHNATGLRKEVAMRRDELQRAR